MDRTPFTDLVLDQPRRPRRVERRQHGAAHPRPADRRPRAGRGRRLDRDDPGRGDRHARRIADRRPGAPGPPGPGRQPRSRPLRAAAARPRHHRPGSAHRRRVRRGDDRARLPQPGLADGGAAGVPRTGAGPGHLLRLAALVGRRTARLHARATGRGRLGQHRATAGHGRPGRRRLRRTAAVPGVRRIGRTAPDGPKEASGPAGSDEQSERTETAQARA